MDTMADQKIDSIDHLFHVARLGLAGRRDDLAVYVQKLVRTLGRTDPERAAKLQDLLAVSQPSNAGQGALRSATMAAVPVDIESRMSLLKEEWPSLDLEPKWSPPIKGELSQVVLERRRTEELLRGGIAPTRSVLFTGPPGVGKTLAARWMAAQLGWPLLTLDLSAVMSSYLGRTGNNVRNVLDYAKGVECVLLLDELDAIAKRRDDGGEVGELKRLVTVLLQEIDEWPVSGLLIGATNHPDLLDPAVWRRFERVIDFPLPDDDTVRELVADLLARRPEVDVGQIAPALALLFRGQSHALIARDFQRAVRNALVHGSPVQEALLALMQERTGQLDKKARKSLSATLVQAGVSQRTASKLTGTSRGTIRSAQRRQGKQSH
ncbi:AAA family ATPase [Pyxidicoccus xibeiensis]|uniref:AAA family ATPase n=1 Tax=Pyxidicoccus xibeiensis TaxID=2906759 RepID=UPI0020A6FE31|nr:ATP-binding protein [Pyxidicoccus xibeiensis]MCP3139023.1 ATP-binding protein [Pyxidicoccus xibeiensis]